MKNTYSLIHELCVKYYANIYKIELQDYVVIKKTIIINSNNL